MRPAGQVELYGGYSGTEALKGCHTFSERCMCR
jgi:hypothetical protein